MSFFKELFTAKYQDGKIIGCKRGSFAYWHEYRHKTQMESPVLNKLWDNMPYITGCLGMLMIWFILLVPKPETLIWGGLFILPLTLLLLWLEFDANMYAIYKKVIK